MTYSYKKKISIIIPVYNVEKYIEKCINSIKKQSYNNFEAIVVNDGSTDKSIEKILPIIDHDSRFRILNKKNAGLSSARNQGIENSTGEYITFIDSDDYIHHNFLQDMIEKTIKTDSDICVCDVQTVGEKGNKIKYLKQNIDSENTSLDIYPIYLEAVSVLPNVGNKLYKKELFNKIKFPTGRYFEDIAVMHEIIFNTKKICYINKPLFYYVIRENSITQTQNEKYFIDRFWVAEYIREELKNKKIYEKYKKNYAILYLVHLVIPIIIYLENNPNCSIEKTKKRFDMDIYSFKNILALARKKLKLSFLLLIFKLVPKSAINILRLIKNGKN
ncbi:glycosyltransferase family 2 protein [Xenorhabdus bovienii]|uniref:Putative Cps2K n=1 Tax=Xenorhabdus bovienii TaxID=40576 RepID=A0A0B6XEL8_XENBV|nr:glycosyltransferase [Xenorhabdus bovienii]CDG86475.1 putative Cps2K [Xenorhabdus bovienii str. feltiae France]CDG90756.1 putative Cps2K [Xenorhabdus bovienii str. feltiae Florida]CDM92010.1 putative Cps2K [Xenorhabdus bovienii]